MKRRQFLKTAAGLFVPSVMGAQFHDLAWIKSPRRQIGTHALTHSAGLPVASFAANSNVAGGTSGGTGRTFLMADIFTDRFRFRGTLSQVKASINAIGTTHKTIKFKVFRKNGSNFDFVGQSEVITLASTGTVTFDLATPITGCLEGDFLGIWVDGDASTPSAINVKTASAAVGMRWLAGDISTTNAFTTNTIANFDMDIDGLVLEPDFVYGGDSIMAGHNQGVWDTWVEATGPAGSIGAQIPYQIYGSQRIPHIYSNCAHGSYKWADVVSASLTLMTALNASAWIIHCGVNDVSAGTTWASVKSSMDSVKAALPAGVMLYIDEILPWTAGSDANAVTIRTWNPLYSQWCADNGAVLIPCHDAMGQIRVSTGFLDDLSTSYNLDGIHLSTAGVTAITPLIRSVLERDYA